MGTVNLISIGPDKGLQLQYPRRVYARKEIGFDGDRYANGNGSHSANPHRMTTQVSIIANELISRASWEFGIEINAWESRRNIVTYRFELSKALGKIIQIGDEAQFHIVQPCPICDECRSNPAQQRLRFKFPHWGYLAEVVKSGFVQINDPIVLVGSPPTRG